MRAWRRTLLGALAVCLLATGSVAEAEQRPAKPKPRFEVHERSLRLSIELRGSNGYRGQITTEGHKRVTLTLRKGNTAVEARASGRVTRHGIEADLGELGEISVRFEGRPFRSGFRNRGERRCHGRKSAIEEGRFSGTISFRGDNGFTQLDSRQATGFVEQHYRRVCRRSASDSFDAIFEDLFGAIRLTSLQSRARVDGANVFFDASAIDLSPLLGPGFGLEYLISAGSVEHREGVRLRRSIYTEGGDGVFLFDHEKGAPLRAATVAPAKPFTGTAEYTKEPGLPASFVGPLAARLPGAGLVALTGPGFRAGLCRLRFSDLIEGNRCLPGPDPAQQRLLSRLSRDLALP